MKDLRARPVIYGRTLIVTLLTLLLLAACGGPEVPDFLTEEQESALIQRVTQKWQAMEARDYAAVYDYTTPNYRRVFSKDMFLNKFGYSVDWELTEAEVLNYDGSAAVASVAVRVMSSPSKPTSEASRILGALPSVHRENWILIDGKWWNSPKI